MKMTGKQQHWNDFLTETSSETLRLFPKVNVIKPRPTLKNHTNKLIKLLTPPIPKSKYEGGIIYLSGGIIARMGFGKTELAKQITKIIISHYGAEKVNVMKSTQVEPLIDAMDDKPVQILFVDDNPSVDPATRKKQFEKFVNIRHELEPKRDTGVIISVWTSQGLFLLDKNYRTMFDFSIIKSSTLNDHDKIMIYHQFGFDALDVLDTITKEKNLKHNFTVLDTSLIKILGEKYAGYVHFDYDSKEAEKVSWKEIEPAIVPIEGTLLIKHINDMAETVWGNFQQIMAEELLKEYPKIKETCRFDSEKNMFDCLTIWFNKFFLGKDEEALEQLNIAHGTSIRMYASRINTYFKSFDTRQFQKTVSEQWVVEGLNNKSPLFTSHALCSDHRTRSNQPLDVCVHDSRGEHVLSINVKWFANNRARSCEVEAKPESDYPPCALLVLSSSLRADHPVAHARFEILPEKEKKRTIAELPIIQKKNSSSSTEEEEKEKRDGKRDNRDNGEILQIIALEIEKLTKNVQEKKNND